MPIFFFTDIEGSTRLWEEHTDEMGTVIAHHDAILREQVGATGGRVTKHTGDGITAAFETGDPLICALETQLRFDREDWGAIRKLCIRIGLHAGKAEWIDGPEPNTGDYFGPPVNATARIMSAAWGGQILLTPDVTNIARLPLMATLEDLGQHLLKNVSTPQQIYQLIHPDLPRIEFPPPRSLSGYAISQTVSQEGERLAIMEPEALAVSLASATLLPTLLGNNPPVSSALDGNIGVLRDLGAGTLADFLAFIAEQLTLSEPDEIRKHLEAALLAQWQVNVALRTDISRLLHAVQGVDAAMVAATSELRQKLVRGLDNLGDQFHEFRWMLGDLQETVTEMYSKQDLQLDLHREQLAKIEELLQLQRDSGRLSPQTPGPEAKPPPAFLQSEEEHFRPPVFVAREQELAKLESFLDTALTGSGQVVFVTGSSGQGKTALLAEFAQKAMKAQPDLLVASGNCNAYSGVGDPYLPFREILSMLTGDVESQWYSGLISNDHARRLWYALPEVAQVLVNHGPHITPGLISGERLLSRVMTAAPEEAPWLQALEAQVARGESPAGSVDQSHIFQQTTNVLRALAQEYPLLLILDDLHWVDTASIGLLFHLGRRLEGARILIVGSYRTVEVAIGRDGERHPLQAMLSEFKRLYGNVWLDLEGTQKAEQRHFIDAILEAEPNSIGEDFRRMLLERTDGHPLFTVELLRDMQGRGDLIRDEDGRWIQAQSLDWVMLPARVEGIIEERINRLEPELREILSIASVEGDTFTVPMLARVHGVEERQVVRWLIQDLEKQHGLVTEQAEVQVGTKRLSRYKFSHALIQNYLYHQLSNSERRLLHEDVASALESIYDEHTDEFAVQLAHHFYKAGNDEQALNWFTQAAENASRVYANDEAYAHYTRAIEMGERISTDAISLTRLYRGRGLAGEMLGKFDQARTDLEANLQIARAADESHLECRALLDLGKLWASRDYKKSFDNLEQALELSRRMGDPSMLAESLNWMGNWHLNAGNPGTAIAHHQEALQIFEELGDRRGLATTLDFLGIANLIRGNISAMLEHYDRAVELFREFGDLPSLASSLTGRGHIGCWSCTSVCTVPSTPSNNPQRDFEEAIRINREIGSPAGEVWVHWSLGLLHLVHGRYGLVFEEAQNGLQISTQIGHHEGELASQCVLGMAYAELLAPEKAKQHLETALTLADEMQSLVLIHWATGALTSVYCQLGDLKLAQSIIDKNLSAETQMDDLYKRQCWTSRAELALCQGDPALTIDIIERLIISDPGISPGGVITLLWMLKSEALSALGQIDEAQILLHEAIENIELTGERSQLWRLHASLGKLYQAIGQPMEANQEFLTARELIDELANTIPAAEVRDIFIERANNNLNYSP
jgi:adenylate cyclase